MTDTWNVESLISYPGFNTALPEGVRDDHKLLHMPPMMPHQQLDFATARLKKPAPVPYKRLRLSTPKEKSSQVNDEADDSTKQDETEKSEDAEKSESPSAAEKIDNNPQQETPRSRLISVGVPVPVPTRKPPLEKWSENNSLSELIYFENLPNYTGVFDKMRSVIGKVRSRLSGGATSSDSPSTSS